MDKWAAAVIGAALIELIRNGFVLTGANTYWEQVFVGVIMGTLLALHDGKPVQEIIYTGVDRMTKTMSAASSRNGAAQAAGASPGMAA